MPKPGNVKRGRPPGSPNAEYLQAVEIPATCPTCHSDELVVVRGHKPIVRAIAGTIHSVEYVRVEWQRRTCKACGQRVSVRKYYPK